MAMIDGGCGRAPNVHRSPGPLRRASPAPANVPSPIGSDATSNRSFAAPYSRVLATTFWRWSCLLLALVVFAGTQPGAGKTRSVGGYRRRTPTVASSH